MNRQKKTHEIPPIIQQNPSTRGALVENPIDKKKKGQDGVQGPGSLLLAFLETRGRRLLAVIVGDESVEAIDRHFPIGRHHVVDRNTGNLARESDRRRGEGIYAGIGSRDEGGHRRRRAKKRVNVGLRKRPRFRGR